MFSPSTPGQEQRDSEHYEGEDLMQASLSAARRSLSQPVEGVEVPGCGKIFVEFETLTDCEKAQEQLSGRRFAERVVVTSFFDLSRFQNKDF